MMWGSEEQIRQVLRSMQHERDPHRGGCSSECERCALQNALKLLELEQAEVTKLRAQLQEAAAVTRAFVSKNKAIRP